jgi:chromosome segregation ATPase
MARITVDVPDSVLQQIDAEAKQINASRSKWAATAIDAYLHQKCITSDADVMQMKDQAMQLRQQLDAKTQECDAQSQEITHLNNEISEKDDALDRLKQQIKESGSDATRRWEELKGIRSENTKLKKDIDAAQMTTQRLQGELLTKQAEVDRIAALREELAITKTDRDRLQEALKVREEDVAWLRSHVAQLTQQLALPPSEEEAKAKHWYQFWK